MRTVINLNKGWIFEKTDRIPDSWPRDRETIDLPHTWNNIDGQDGGGDYWRGTAAYTRRLEIVKKPDQAYFLEIKGCSSSADVYLNGAHLAHHDGGYSTFRAELSGALTDGENLLTVIADNRENDRVYPQAADFTFYGGLYRDVNLISVPRQHFELVKDGSPGIRVTPVCKGEDYEVTVDAWHNGSRVKITVDGQKRIVEGKGRSTAVFLLPNARLWDGLADPWLYEAKAQLLDDNGDVLDEVSTSFGCRTFRIDPQEGFFLNGRPYPLRGVSRHQDRAGVGSALTRAMHEEDMAIIREMGANSVRLAHYQHDQYFYDLCDRYGLVVWAEIPYISAHMEGGRENTLSQMRELITQNYNHPSIVVWGLSNEITMQGGITDGLRENHDALQVLVRQMDPSRPTVMAHVSMLDIDEPIVRFPDAAAYNVYFGWYSGELKDNEKFFDTFHAKYPDMPMGFSEYGCDTNPAYHTANPQRGDYTEEYQRVYHEYILDMIDRRPWLWCTYAWNMFDFAADARDEGGTPGVNQKGLVTMDRKTRKDVYYLYKAHWSREPFVHLCGRRYVDRTEAVTDVTVYTNQAEVELYVDGTLFEKKQGGRIMRFQVTVSGEHTIEARSGDHRDAITIRHVSEENPDYKLKGGGILNWFDADGLKADCYCIEDLISELMKAPEAAKTVMRCVNTRGKDESDFIKELRAEPERLKSLDITFNEMLDRCGGIESNIRRHINAALQRVKRRDKR